MKIVAVFLFILAGLFFVALFACVAALPTMLLWNWLVPSIFHLREIGFLEALGMLILSGLLVRGGSASKSS
jgi:hypothetical protein